MALTSILAVGSLAATAIGTGIAYQSSQNAAAVNDQFAAMNARSQMQGARQQGAMQAAQSQLEAIKAGKATKLVDTEFTLMYLIN